MSDFDDVLGNDKTLLSHRFTYIPVYSSTTRNRTTGQEILQSFSIEL